MSLKYFCLIFVAFCVVLSAFQQLGESRAVVSVRLLAYRNAENRKSDGRCCNGVAKRSICTIQCKPTFALCLDQADSKKEDLSGCSMGKMKDSGTVAEKSRIDFTSNVGSLKNPEAWMLDKWPGSVKLIIRIGQEQLNNKAIAMWSQILTFIPRAGKGKSQIRHFKTDKFGISLDARVNVTCASGYYDVDCAKFCSPSGEDHYNCDLNGRKVCHRGWEGTNCTINVDDCKEKPCKNKGTCQDLVDGFGCLCLEGFEGPQCETDINECSESGVCGNGNCVNMQGSYRCNCFKGYSGSDCSIFTDICDSQPCQNGGRCENIKGDFLCHCPQQFSGTTCTIDVDECKENNPCPDRSPCINQYGSFMCSCQPGWRGQLCDEDINECAESSPCFILATCVNTPGSYHCLCPPTYTGSHCMQDVDECSSMPCENHGTCTNLAGNFLCACRRGYTGRVCELDINECNRIIKPCQNGGVCLNSHGSFSCRCNIGYKGSLCEDDINECEEETAVCKNGASCINLDGSFKCRCTEFWQGAICDINVDECLSSPCGNHGECVNIDEGYTCDCHAGWLGKTCEIDDDECETNETVCKNGGTCHNTPGSYLCNCKAGWEGQNCDHDINECDQVNICHVNGFCQNTEGGFMCRCEFQWTGKSCEMDKNECVEHPGICGPNGTCHNLVGDFWCICDPGLDGSRCDRDIDECFRYPDICTQAGNFTPLPPKFSSSTSVSLSVNSTNGKGSFLCENQPGGYRCVCQDGWAGHRCNTPKEVIEHGENNVSIFLESVNKSKSSTISQDQYTPRVHTTSAVVINNSKKITNAHIGNQSEPSKNNDQDSPEGGDLYTDDSLKTTPNNSSWTNDSSTMLSNTSQIPNLTIPNSVNENIFPEVNVPFYLYGKVPRRQRRLIDSGISNLLKETRLFQGKELSVISAFAYGVGSDGEKITKVHPTVQVDGGTLSDKEVAALLHRVAYKFSQFIKLPLYTGEVVQQIDFDPHKDKFSDSWIWAPIIAALLLLALLIAVFVNVARRYGRLCTYIYKVNKEKQEHTNTSSTYHDNEAFDFEQEMEENAESEETTIPLAGLDNQRKDKPKSMMNPMYNVDDIYCGPIPIREIGPKIRSRSEDTSSTGFGDAQADGHPGKPFVHNNNQTEVTVHHGWAGDTGAQVKRDFINSRPLPSRPEETDKDLASGCQHIRDATSRDMCDTITCGDMVSTNTHKYETLDCLGFLLDGTEDNSVSYGGGLEKGDLGDKNIVDPDDCHEEEALKSSQPPRGEGLKQDMESPEEETVKNGLLQTAQCEEDNLKNGPVENGGSEQDREQTEQYTPEQEESQDVLVRQTVVQMEPIIRQVTRQERRSVEIRQQLTHPRTPTCEVATIRKSTPTLLKSDRERLAAEEDEYDKHKNFRYIDEPVIISLA